MNAGELFNRYSDEKLVERIVGKFLRMNREWRNQDDDLKQVGRMAMFECCKRIADGKVKKPYGYIKAAVRRAAVNLIDQEKKAKLKNGRKIQNVGKRKWNPPTDNKEMRMVDLLDELIEWSRWWPEGRDFLEALASGSTFDDAVELAKTTPQDGRDAIRFLRLVYEHMAV